MFAKHPDHRFLVLYVGEHRAGCSYHQPWPELESLLPGRRARFLRFLALHDAWQGTELPGMGRASLFLVAATMDDVRATAPAVEIVGGQAHGRNERSMRLINALGWAQRPYEQGYVTWA